MRLRNTKKTLRSHKNKGTVSDNGNLDAITLDPVCEKSCQMAVDEPVPASASKSNSSILINPSVKLLGKKKKNIFLYFIHLLCYS